jgi:hypothetical protein
MSTISDSLALYDFIFDGTYLMLPNTPYCIALQVKTGLMSDGGIAYLLDTTGSTHPGNEFHYANSAWTADSGWDSIFYIYGKMAPLNQKYTLSITTPGGGGTVTRNPDLLSYPYGFSVQLTALPNPGYSFYAWGGNLSGNMNPATMIMDSNKTVIATFTQDYTLFATGYESADNTWSSQTVSTGESVAVSSSMKHHGSYAGRYSSSGSTSTTAENAYNTVNVNEGDIFVRGYFYIDGGLPLANYGDRFYCIRFRSVTGETLASVGVRCDTNGVSRWSMVYRDSYSLYYSLYTEPAVVTDRWYCVELHWFRSTTRGVVDMWIDGVSMTQMTDLHTDTAGNVALVDVGIVSSTSIQSGLVIYSDCIQVNRGYIGLE